MELNVVFTSIKEALIIFTVIVVCILPALKAYYFENHPDRTVSQLESTLATLPLGISSTEADAIIGTQPDSITQTRGVLVNHTMLLHSSNEQAMKYRSIESNYSLRIWKRGDVYAIVAIDDSGKVAGRWSCVESKLQNHNRYSLYSVFKRLKDFF